MNEENNQTEEATTDLTRDQAIAKVVNKFIGKLAQNARNEDRAIAFAIAEDIAPENPAISTMLVTVREQYKNCLTAEERDYAWVAFINLAKLA